MKKKKILKNIIKPYEDVFGLKTIDDSFYFDTPGNILKYLLILKNKKLFIKLDEANLVKTKKNICKF